jgi:putative phosphoserine phosphatase/1-acylglycerol-3-phosphate O-acyltransferase
MGPTWTVDPRAPQNPTNSMNPTNPMNPANPMNSMNSMNSMNPTHTEGRIGAFFDFDKTLIDVESGRIGFKYLYEIKEIRLLFLLKVALTNFLYERDWISDTQMARIMLTFYKNRDIKPLEDGSDAFYQTYLKPHIAPNILKRVREHQDAGHILVLVSASLRYMLTPVVRDLGFHHLLCTDLEIADNGLLSGRTDGPICIHEHKRVAVTNLAREACIRLDQSYAYGNHHSDIPMLQTVGYPRAVEPTAPLKKRAVESGWPILTFR